MSDLQQSPQQQFETASARAAEAARSAKAKANRLSIIRLLTFFGGVALAVLVGVEVHPLAAVGVVAVGLYLFNKLIGQQQALDEAHRRFERIVELNAEELLSLKFDFAAFDSGEDFADAQHPFSGDLDIYGANSLFQQHNRTASLVGRCALAEWMQRPLQRVADIVLRQEAIKELLPQLAWRQQFLAAGSNAPANVSALQRLRQWASSSATLTESYWRWIIPVLSIFNVLWLASFFYLPFYIALLGYLPTIYLLSKAKSRVDVVHTETEEAVALLTRYQAMLGWIERTTWSSPLLAALAEFAATTDASPASNALQQLAYDSKQLALRVNPFVLLLNLFSFWEIRYARRLEQWKVQHLTASGNADFPAAAQFHLPSAADATTAPQANALEHWLLTLGAFDALTSLAAAAFRWPDWTFPRFDESATASINGAQLKHPLLAPARSVGNDFSSPARAHINLLTGSNMAGKSTFLRTVGLHIAMAHWGAATPAQSLSLPLLQVYTSMRTQDNLHEGASAFYAELQRLRFVVEATHRGDNVFFLLDEILKGTNSQDRQEGGKALLRQLIRHGGAGIVATHDLELGELAADTTAITTIRLEVETDTSGQLYFDYTVKPGLAESRNASILMEQMGLGMN